MDSPHKGPIMRNVFPCQVDFHIRTASPGADNEIALVTDVTRREWRDSLTYKSVNRSLVMWSSSGRLPDVWNPSEIALNTLRWRKYGCHFPQWSNWLKPSICSSNGSARSRHMISNQLYGNHSNHDDVIKRKYFPRYWPFVRGIHRSPVNSPHKGQWRGALMYSLICTWINGWVNNREAGDLRRHRAHYDVTVMAI